MSNSNGLFVITFALRARYGTNSAVILLFYILQKVAVGMFDITGSQKNVLSANCNSEVRFLSQSYIS
jgi:hypothetical protein